MARDRKRQQETDLQERVVFIRRVSKTVKGGRRMSLVALVVVGDGKGNVGLGSGRSAEVPLAIQKAVDDAKKNMFKVPITESGSVPHAVEGHYGAGRVLIQPAVEGTGVIAGGPVRAVLEAAGVQDVLTKSLGSDNALNIVRATVAALKQLETPEAVAARRGLPVERVAPSGMLRAQAEGEAEKKAQAEQKEAAKASAGVSE